MRRMHEAFGATVRWRVSPAFGVAYVLLFTAAGILSSTARGPAEARAIADTPHAEFVGTEVCGQCHERQLKDWSGSDHAAAMQVANERTALGRFDGATFTKDGIDSRFFKRDGRLWVRTDGPDGKLADFEIRYTFGHFPLQQYLIELPGGRLQALGIAWDQRPAAEGGQRWFHLYPNQRLAAGHPLHWTGIDQNWNYQCAACHSTNLKKNYDAASETFATSWSEISVGCEACHGPGAKHVEWASASASSGTTAQDVRSDDPLHGFAKRFDERKGASWQMGQDGQAHRSVQRSTMTEIETCAQCHSRRQQFSDATATKLLDAFRPSLLEPPLYYADGQQRDEVFTYGSFLQSRMHAAGVTCSDCHNPHSGKLRENGNALCGQCHSPERFDTEKHHRHVAGGKGSECVSCHMPAATYMGVDARRDHSFRIPRPAQTANLGVPNACQTCHETSSAAWFADAMKRRFAGANAGFQSFADAFDRADRAAPGAQEALLKLASDAAQPPLVRASAIGRLRLSRRALEAVATALGDGDAAVRLAAVQALAGADAALKQQLLVPLLSDTTRTVRMEAARGLAGTSERMLDEAARKRFEAAIGEYVAAQEFNGERPEQQVNLAGLFAARGDGSKAEAALRRALKLDPTFVPAFVLLAEVKRTSGDEAAAEATLRDALISHPGSGELLHALGLSLVRQKRTAEAVDALVRAASGNQSVARYSYVAALALYDSGRAAEADDLLEQALATHPYDRQILYLVAVKKLQAGDSLSALKHAELLRSLEPEDSAVAQLYGSAVQKAR
ncbi:MAG: multiheme c-type cytochrome [Hyphomicrobium sp.]